jgi:GNAT superfamily N-acetyltransferase
MEYSIDYTFTDKQDRTIHVEYINNIILAHANDKKVGYIEFEERDEYYFLSNLLVIESYQRAGIGTELVSQAAKMYGKNFSRPRLDARGGYKSEAHTYFTEEGAALIEHCIKKGILDGDWPDADGKDD